MRHGHHTFDGSPVSIRFPCATSVELQENSCRIIPKQAGIPGSDRHPKFTWGSRIPSDLLHTELGSGTRPAGGPALCYKDVWKRCKKANDINLTVRQNAATRDRQSIPECTKERPKLDWEVEKGKRRKTREGNSTTATRFCFYQQQLRSKTCCSKIRLYSQVKGTCIRLLVNSGWLHR